MSEHVRRSMYAKRLSMGQHRYGADGNWGVLDEVPRRCGLVSNYFEKS